MKPHYKNMRDLAASMLDILCGLTHHGKGSHWWYRHVCLTWADLVDE